MTLKPVKRYRGPAIPTQMQLVRHWRPTCGSRGRSTGAALVVLLGTLLSLPIAAHPEVRGQALRLGDRALVALGLRRHPPARFMGAVAPPRLPSHNTQQAPSRPRGAVGPIRSTPSPDGR